MMIDEGSESSQVGKYYHFMINMPICQDFDDWQNLIQLLVKCYWDKNIHSNNDINKNFFVMIEKLVL